MARPSSSRRQFIAEINVVPYIDVMLVLLIIFMITAPLLKQGVDVDLPIAPANPLSVNSPEPIIVSVDENGLLYLNIASEPDSRRPSDVVGRRRDGVGAGQHVNGQNRPPRVGGRDDVCLLWAPHWDPGE